MDLRFTSEQDLLGEAVRQMLSQRSEASSLIDASQSKAVWRDLVEFGGLNVGVGDEELGAVELAIVARALGERLAPIPYGDSVAVRYALGTAFPTLPVGASFATGLIESGMAFVPHDAQTTWTGTLSGEKRAVLFAPVVDELVIAASSESGPVIARVPVGTLGISNSPELTLDSSLLPERVRFANVALDADRVLTGTRVRGQLERLSAIGAVLTSAQSVGAASSVLGLARDYAADRTQFGRTIGSFQALRHMMAEMYVGVESSWSSVLYAAAALDENYEGCLATASIAKAYSARSTLDVAHQALQVFGGIAFTSEHPAHLYLRRIQALASHFGSAREHEGRIGRVLASHGSTVK